MQLVEKLKSALSKNYQNCHSSYAELQATGLPKLKPDTAAVWSSQTNVSNICNNLKILTPGLSDGSLHYKNTDLKLFTGQHLHVAADAL